MELFPVWANTAYRLGLTAVVLVPAAVVTGLMLYVRSGWNTRVGVPRLQPVQFDHRHHAADDGIDCLFCHREAERGPLATIPSTAVCMGCHAQVWNDSPLLEPVRKSFTERTPIAWARIYDLAGFVYFNHSVHVQRGVGCVRCHGRVDTMARLSRAQALQMQWCLDCHRNPRSTLSEAPEVGPVALATDRAFLGSVSLDGLPEDGRQITRLTTCSACHR
jgi:hypothetical protein